MPSQLKPEALAHFQNHWKRFLQSSKPKPSCQRCHRPVSSKHLVSVKKQYSYHSHCLTCYLCCVPLKPNMEVRECNGHVYCSKHYELILSKPDCATCHTAIEPTTRPTKAFGVYFHLEHLKCCQCLRPVDEFANGIVRHKKRIYCRPHFNELYLPKCRGCGKAVEKESVSSSDGKLDGKFHKKCFRCHACQQPFADHTFYVYKNQPYCKHDYHQLNHSLCSKCKAPVEGRCAKTSDGQKFHPQCFQCHDCHQLIQDVYYTDNRNRIFCPNHSVDLQTDKRTTTFFDI
ncbi:hypothetical protein DM01DRAFT_1175683 [Hesseltinella vesiculosa]|uniref:LIM zinc-binding domain-containing protein n=1 Tax=Hesseltinella vesiculosa TaxID=101127 RepID=A0A1X2G4W0_9FUNG|nr:hypothetical protein DM01DRAFT_1175683 [Hesseltinella vesiculosa]